MFRTNSFMPKNFWVLLLFCSAVSFGQSNYRNFNEQTNALKRLQTNHPEAKLQSLTKTVGGFDIWALTLSKGNPEDKPAIAIVGGIDGSLLLSTEMAISMAENILKNHSEVLDNTTFYIFPNMSPNASEQYFKSLKYENKGNAKSTDDDRDGMFDEDPFEDLNKDGLITLMRVEDVTGNYVKSKEDERIMVKANPADGELGAYKIFSEGIDNDKDGKYNEDGQGGIVFNKNFSFNFPYFKPGAGEHPVSEKEHRALLDFLYLQWNVYAIISLGPENNLSTPLKFNAEGAKKRVVTSILKNDAKLNAFISKQYNKINTVKDAPKAMAKGGGFFEWSYFHFGRLALSTPGWWPAKFKGDSTVKAHKNVKANYLQLASQDNINNVFVDWTKIDHPDFPNKTVEVGGISPFVMQNPAYEKVAEISKTHTDFVLELAKLQPNISIENVSVEAVNNELTRITVDVHNNGLLPTHTDMGKRSRWLRKIKIELSLNKDQTLIAGKKIELITAIDGDSSKQLTWLIHGNGSVKLQAGTSHTGTDSKTITLK